MFDLKTMRSALEQLEEERKIPKEKIIEAIEQALAAAYKKDYGKKGQIIRATIDIDTGKTEFSQVKIVVDESLVRIVEEGEEEMEETEGPPSHKASEGQSSSRKQEAEVESTEEEDERIRFNPEHHIMLEDAQKIKKNAKLEEEIIFPLEVQEDFGRIAAQTAKQVIIQRIREAEKDSIINEYQDKEGTIVSGIIQKVERGTVFIDFDRTTGILPPGEQIFGERYHQGGRIRAYLYQVEETPRGVNLRLSRTHPQFLAELFAIEVPEIADGVVEIKSIAREAGKRSKMAVMSHDENIDPVGSCVGQKGIRVTTVMNELGGEKIDIIEWSEDSARFVASALSPAQVLDIEIDEKEHKATIEVADDQLSLAIGKGGQNVRLAAKLTGWKIDIRGAEGESIAADESDTVVPAQTNAEEKEAGESAPEEEKKEEVEEKKEKKIKKKEEKEKLSEAKSASGGKKTTKAKSKKKEEKEGKEKKEKPKEKAKKPVRSGKTTKTKKEDKETKAKPSSAKASAGKEKK